MLAWDPVCPDVMKSFPSDLSGVLLELGNQGHHDLCPVDSSAVRGDEPMCRLGRGCFILEFNSWLAVLVDRET